MQEDSLMKWLIERLKYLTVRRFLNRAVSEFDSALRRTRVASYPVFLIVEPCNFCNLKCPLCPTGQRLPAERGKMTMETFISIIDQLSPYCWHLNLFYLGEPLLCENLPVMIDYARRRKMEVSVSSNLNLLSEEMADRLIDANLDHLIVSLDGTSQEIYEKYRIGGNFNKVIDNIILLNQKKKQKVSPYPRIEIQFVVFKHNEQEVPLIKELAAKLGVGFYLREGTLGGKEQSPPLTKDYSLAEQWLSPNKEYHKGYDYFERKPYIQEGYCGYLWKIATINWDGSVFPCCWVFEGKYKYGNIMEQSFKTIWNNELMQSSRSLFKKNKRSRPDAETGGPKTICYQCKMFKHICNDQC